MVQASKTNWSAQCNGLGNMATALRPAHLRSENTTSLTSVAPRLPHFFPRALFWHPPRRAWRCFRQSSSATPMHWSRLSKNVGAWLQVQCYSPRILRTCPTGYARQPQNDLGNYSGIYGTQVLRVLTILPPDKHQGKNPDPELNPDLKP